MPEPVETPMAEGMLATATDLPTTGTPVAALPARAETTATSGAQGTVTKEASAPSAESIGTSQDPYKHQHGC